MNNENNQKWGRKQKVSLQTMLFLLIGLALAAWMNLDFQLYLCYVAGITGGSTAFMWSNSLEHKYNSQTTEPPKV